MVTTQTKETLPPLIKKSSTFKMVVPENVENKIRYLLHKFPSTEWSGVLFYTFTGSFENKDLLITCQDVFPMDLGNATYTEFNMSEDVASYMAENIELFECELGLIHSHHSMSTFFSGTDTSTLREEGNERNCFVSLIVNNEGTYSAAITRKVKTETQVLITNTVSSYEFFGNGEVSNQSSAEREPKSVTKECIEYFMLDVERKEVINPYDYLDKRFDEIKAKKTILAKPPMSYKQPPASYKQKTFDFWNSFEDPYYSKWQYQEPKKKEVKLEDEEPFYVPDPDIVHHAVCQLISCSLIIKSEKFDLKQWITKHMDIIYEKIFHIEDEGDEAFHIWADFGVDYILFHFPDPGMPPSSAYGEDEVYSAIAQAIVKEIERYNTDDNEYLKYYCERFNEYIV